MKKVLQVTILSCCLVGSSFAQTTIPNENFESWINSGQATNWSSNKQGLHNASTPGATCAQSNIAHSGNYSAKVTTISFVGTVVNGSLTTGQVDAPDFTKSHGYIGDVVGSGYISSFTGRPDSLIFWYQYTPSGQDSASVQVRLHVGNCYAPETPVSNNHPDSSVNIIARALWNSAGGVAQSTWKKVVVPFVYVNGNTPAYILITVTPSASNVGGSSGSTMLLDDMSVYYIPVLTTGTVTTGPYYVSAANSTTISVPFTLTGTMDSSNVVTAQLSDANGSFASPVTLGNLTTMTSGTITGTIPAGTATGTGYRVRVVSSTRALTAANNGSDIIINLIGNSIAPSTTQNIAANVDGNVLTVTETAGQTSRQWEYATVSGGPYAAFGSPQTGTTFTPNFNSTGSYYVVCVSNYPGSLAATSNEVRVNVVSNSIAPTSSQSILVGVNGTTLTVTETPSGTSREWKYGTATGGPYQSFGTVQTGTTYTPNFASAGSYYVVCQSVINGITATSNEVLVTVGSATITTQAVTGSPFLFSPSAPAATVSVAYVTSGTFNGGNVFTAQLSDATGSFSSPVTIGTHTGTGSGTITATIPSSTAAGTAYRIRVISSSPVITGTDNGTDLIIDQFHTSIAPTAVQTIQHGVDGNALTVTTSQPSTYVWKYSTTSGSGYTDFSTAQTGATYTPNFALPGIYYVVCISTNQYSDADTSNEVEIIVQNGNSLVTLAIAGSPFNVSDSSDVQVSVGYNSDAQFNNGNTFQAQLSDYTGSFATPVSIGSLTGTSSTGVVTATIPNGSVSGNNYRIRVVSSDPVLTGTPDSTDLTIIQFAATVSPADTQVLIRHQYGNLLTATSNQAATYNWQFSTIQGSGYISFSPARTTDTLSPVFNNVNTYYVVCNVTNGVNASVLTPEVVVVVNLTNGINGPEKSTVKAYWDNADFVADLTDAQLKQPVLELINITGKVVFKASMNALSVNRFTTQLPQGMYVFKIVDGQQLYSGKTVKQ